MGITGRANLERQKSTRLGRSPGAIVRVRFGAYPAEACQGPSGRSWSISGSSVCGWPGYSITSSARAS